MVRSVLFIAFEAAHKDDLVNVLEHEPDFVEAHFRSAESDAVVIFDSKDDKMAEQLAHRMALQWMVRSVRHAYIVKSEKDHFTRPSGHNALGLFFVRLAGGSENDGLKELAGIKWTRDVVALAGPDGVLVTGPVRDHEELGRRANDIKGSVRYVMGTAAYLASQSIAK